MENASKALIMAGAILIAILIISLGILLFNKFGNSAKEAANMDEQEIAAFNSKITPYIGNNISGSQVNALIQYIISVDTSAVSNNDSTKSVKISFPVTTPTGTTATNTIYVKNNSGTFSVVYEHTDYPKKVTTGSTSYYKVTATYGDNGLINTITVE